MGDDHQLIPHLLHSEQDFLDGVYRLLGQPFGSSAQPQFLPDFLAQLKKSNEIVLPLTETVSSKASQRRGSASDSKGLRGDALKKTLGNCHTVLDGVLAGPTRAVEALRHNKDWG